MRSTALLSSILLLGVVLGACDGDDSLDGECSDADVARADTILNLAADESAGAAVFAQSCGNSACHGADGVAGGAPDLDEHIPEHDAEYLACLVLAGEGGMPSQAAFSDQELADVLAYVQATF